MAAPQRHEKVVDALAKDIFLGKLKPDSKLPTEKQLSEAMGVDRTSLRVGLKQLESMRVLTIRRGDGIYVNDYLKEAGLDFLAFAFQRLEEVPADAAVDGFLLDEIWEFWILFWPPVLQLAVQRASTRDIRATAELIARQEACVRALDRKGMAESLISLQDKTAEIVNNSLVLLLFNSCRPFRRRMIELLFASMDETELAGVVEVQRTFLQRMLEGSDGERREALNALRDEYRAYRRRMREWMSRALDAPSP